MEDRITRISGLFEPSRKFRKKSVPEKSVSLVANSPMNFGDRTMFLWSCQPCSLNGLSISGRFSMVSQ